MKGSTIFTSHSEQQTRSLARSMGRRMRPMDLVCLDGPMGSGKTTFVQGLAAGTGFKGQISSPSFAIAKEYRGPRFRLYHLDLYRVNPQEIPNLGLEDFFFDPCGACVIEWAEVIRKDMPLTRLEIQFALLKGTGRRLRFKVLGPCRHLIPVRHRGRTLTRPSATLSLKGEGRVRVHK